MCEDGETRRHFEKFWVVKNYKFLSMVSFLGPSREAHFLFVASVCRLQHVSVPLILIHYLTWSVVGVCLYVGLATSLGITGAVLVLTALSCWLLSLDWIGGGVFTGFALLHLWIAVRYFAPLPSHWMMALLPVISVVAVAVEVSKRESFVSSS